MDELIVGYWEKLGGRDVGPFAVRLIVQPLMASFFALRSGLRDAREGRPVFFWTAITDSTQRAALVRDGWKDIGKLFIGATVMDVIYQIVVFKWVYPLQALVVATALAVVPYLVVRGLTNRIARRMLKST